MAFDLNTARPASGGFDISSAQPVDTVQPAQQPAAPDIQSMITQFNQAQQSGDFQTADQIRQQMNQIQSGAIGGTLEAAGTIGSGIVAEPLAGIAGLVSTPFVGSEGGANIIEGARDALTFQPRTEEGKQQLQAVGGALAPVGAAFEAVETGLGDFAFDVTGRPEIAAAAATVPTLVGELLGLGILKKVRKGTQLLDDLGNPTKELRTVLDKQGLVYENLTPEAKQLIPAVADKNLINISGEVSGPASKALVKQIKSGGKDDALAGIKVTNGKVVNDPLGSEALKQGYAPGFVQSVKVANKATKKAMNDMTNIMRRIKGSERLGLDIRPSDVLGDAITERFKYLRRNATSARLELDDLAKTALKDKTIDTDGVVNALQKSLDDLDVSVLWPQSGGKPQLNFEGSMISKDRTSQRVIQNVVDLMGEQSVPDALRAHKLKRQLDTMLDFNKKSARGLTDSGKRVAGDIRSALNDAVRAVDPDYARVNDVMSGSLTAIDDFQKAAGSSLDIFGKGADSKIGTKMRALTSNIGKRVDLENAINQLDDTVRGQLTARGQGVVPFRAGADGAKLPDVDTDIKTLQMMANALDARFGAVAKSSFQGNIEQAINRVLNQGVSQEVLGQGANFVGKQVKKARKIDDFHAFEAMDDLLKAAD